MSVHQWGPLRDPEYTAGQLDGEMRAFLVPQDPGRLVCQASSFKAKPLRKPGPASLDDVVKPVEFSPRGHLRKHKRPLVPKVVERAYF
ncbi:hypothetical protein CC2G_007410 [Coprinopsis cinerea AmutBmut pab1-1]|nr:hypothetical protein CC2G_007410 [Coprinopsis cinerea AmutBmut pab1-1]